jgi:hypothetical protein
MFRRRHFRSPFGSVCRVQAAQSYGYLPDAAGHRPPQRVPKEQARCGQKIGLH